jgi:hypothetical protein
VTIKKCKICKNIETYIDTNPDGAYIDPVIGPENEGMRLSL